MMNWIPGRQGTGYRKLCLWRAKTWDLYLLDYPNHAEIPLHVDEVPEHRHFRANLRLSGDKDSFWTPKKNRIELGPLTIFCSDIPHGVQRSESRRVVLSLGCWIRPNATS